MDRFPDDVMHTSCPPAPPPQARVAPEDTVWCQPLCLRILLRIDRLDYTSSVCPAAVIKDSQAPINNGRQSLGRPGAVRILEKQIYRSCGFNVQETMSCIRQEWPLAKVFIDYCRACFLLACISFGECLCIT